MFRTLAGAFGLTLISGIGWLLNALSSMAEQPPRGMKLGGGDIAPGSLGSEQLPEKRPDGAPVSLGENRARPRRRRYRLRVVVWYERRQRQRRLDEQHRVEAAVASAAVTVRAPAARTHWTRRLRIVLWFKRRRRQHQLRRETLLAAQLDSAAAQVERPLPPSVRRLPGTRIGWPRTIGLHGSHRWTCKRLVLVASATLALVLAGGVIAYLSAGSTAGSYAQAKAATLDAGTTPGTPSVAGRNVTVTWAQVSPAFLGGRLGANLNGGYLIKRYAESGGGAITSGATCNGVQQGSTASLSCTENGLPTGRWKYTTTTKYYNWFGSESGMSVHAIIPPADPISVSFVNGAGAGNAYINSTNENSLSFDVGLPSTSLSTDTITLTLGDGVPAHDVTATVSGTNGAGTVHFTGVDGSTLDDGSIGVSARAKSSYNDPSPSSASTSVTKDTTNPTNSLTVAAQLPAGSSFLSGSTVYYRGTGGGSGGSFKIQNAVSDGSSGPASSTTSALGGTTTGWSHTPSTVTTPSGGPYVSNSFAWSEGTTSSPTEVVTGADAAGNTSATPALTFTNDSTAPTGGALTVNGQTASSGGTTGYNNAGSFTISAITDYTDVGGSGLASSTLVRDQAPLTSSDGLVDGTCGTFASPTTIASRSTPITQTLTGPNCYRYTLTGTDNVGNTVSIKTTVKVDTSAPSVPALTIAETPASNFQSVSGTTLYYNPQGANSGTFRVDATSTDSNSGIQKLNFPSVTGFGSGGDDTTSPYQATYSWTASSPSSGAQTVTSTNNAGGTASSSFTLTSDTTGPTGGALTVNGTGASSGGSSSYSTSTSFTISRTDYNADAGSGVATSVLTRETAPLTSSDGLVDGTCGTYTGLVTLSGNTIGTGITTANCYRYTLTGTDNVGNTSIIVTVVKVDTSAPSSPGLTLTETPASSFQFVSGTTLFYNPQSTNTGTFRVDATSSDSQSGIQKLSFPSVPGFGAGGDDATSPYQSSYTWTASSSASGAQTVTSTNNAGGTANSTFTLTADTTNPGSGALTVNGVAASGVGSSSSSTTTSFTIGVRTNYTDGGSGLASSTLTVQSETFSNNVCGAPGSGGPFTSPTTVTGTTQPAGITGGFCYLYMLTGTDNVGNTASISTTVKVDTVAPTGNITAPTNGTTLGGTITVTSNSADTGGSGVASAQFQVAPHNGAFANLGAAVTSSPFQTSWDTTTVANGSYDLKVTTTDNAGNSFTSAIVTVTVNNTFSVSAPATATAGTAFNVTITALANGVTNTDYTGSKAVSFSGPSAAPDGTTPTFPSSVTFTNGVGTASVTLFNAQTTTISATSGNLSGTSGSVTISPRAAAGLTFTSATNKNGSVTISCTGTVGSSGFTCTNSNSSSGNSRSNTAKLTLIDQYQNVTTNTTGSSITVSLSSTGATPSPTSLSIANGATTSSLSFTQTLPNGSGSVTITATASIPASVSAKWTAT